MRTIFYLEDSYGNLETDHVVFNSKDVDDVTSQMPIDTVLSSISPEILQLAKDDSFLGINVQITLEVEGGEENMMPGGTMMNAMQKQVSDAPPMIVTSQSDVTSEMESQITLDEPGSPREDLSFSLIGRLTVDRQRTRGLEVAKRRSNTVGAGVIANESVSSAAQ